MRSIFALMCVAAALVSFGCGSTNGPSGTGTLNVHLTDSPFTDAKAVLVTFQDVSVHREDADWTKVPFADPAAMTRTCDLKKLQGPTDILGTGSLTAGHYTQIRLMIVSTTIYFENPTDPAVPPCATTIAEPAGTKALVTIPSGEVKLNRSFDLAPNAMMMIELDFDGDRSLHLTGSNTYTLTPVVAIKSVQ
ncbi:MAG TPA: DUF4382 domain-containing protein [Vicinamibacterales bacterium]|nr:DUF4382 domain-containing protein [Vicinamibacterales bacterium]